MPRQDLTNRDKAFLRAEFQSLRQEILGLKERVIKEVTIGLTGIPILLGAGFNAHYHLLIILSPVIVVAGYLMLLFEQNSIMRAGTYIGVMIEDNLLDHPTLGWEDWLERRPKNREAEMYFHYSSAIAFVIYYVVGSYLAYYSSMLPEVSGSFPWLSYLVKYFYGSLFLFTLYFVIKNFRTHSELREFRKENL